MQVTLTNIGQASLLLSCDGAPEASLESGVARVIDSAGVWLIGDRAGPAVFFQVTFANSGAAPIRIVSNADNPYMLPPAETITLAGAQYIELRD
jgi:hypothetical protein